MIVELCVVSALVPLAVLAVLVVLVLWACRRHTPVVVGQVWMLGGRVVVVTSVRHGEATIRPPSGQAHDEQRVRTWYLGVYGELQR